MPRVPAVTHATEEITPELAARYLEQNKLNRPVRQSRVSMLAREMAEGRWVENGEAGITFDTNEDIAGGQHTLRAVVASGATITVRVTRGVAPGVRSTMNGSLQQTFSDDLTVLGVPSAAKAATLLRKIMIWEDAAGRDADGLGGLALYEGKRISRAETMAAWPQYGEGCSAAVVACNRWHRSWPMVGNTGALEFMWWLLAVRNECDLATVEKFFDRLALGSQDPEDRILYRVREKMHKKPNGVPYQVFWMCKGWNAWTSGYQAAQLALPEGRRLVNPYPRLQRAR